ncbi:S24 family peptidase [Sphingomonas sp. M1-B02]|uniref:S24 family peptidase n=1 Tax=Sphingomonas sp. M1-B02 TaxID=3114300 RepID=UPI00224088C5|nr:S24 family peptidase [Sphingomonas sp. S6-11]UZK66103.1 S24 family peptidase [Sphingomonas sp. S6-11]
MDFEEQRAAFSALTAETGVSLSELSRVIGRNPAYLQQYVRRGSPRQLGERERGLLARYLGVPEARLGGPERGGLIEIPRLDVGASAGPGRVAEGEAARRPGAMAPEQLRQLGVRAAAASIIRVEGESMEPLLCDGDEILIDRDRREVPRRGGIFVIRLDDTLMVKRLRPAVGALEVISDNPAYPPRTCSREEVEVIGQVAWLGRSLV